MDNIAGAQPGSLEEALLYAQTYGDVWTDAAKKFLEEASTKTRQGGASREGRRAERPKPASDQIRSPRPA